MRKVQTVKMSKEQVDAHLESGDLLGALGAVADAAEGIRREMKRKLLRNAIIMGTLLFVAVGALIVGIVGVSAAHEARDAAKVAHIAADKATQANALILAQREESRRVVCENSNEGQLGARHAHQTESHALVAAIVGANPSASVVAQAVTFNATQDALIVADYPLRKCDPESLRAFYNDENPKKQRP